MESEVIKFSWENAGKKGINIIESESYCVLSSAHNLSNELEIFNKLYKSKEIRKLYYYLQETLPDQKEEINSSYFFKSKESKEIKIHQDNAYFNFVSGIDCLTFYIPVHYQSKTKGTIFYFSGSHSLGDLDHETKGNLGASMCLKTNSALKNFNIEYLTLNPGDMVLHNGLVVHGTLGNKRSLLCEAFNFTLFGENNKQDYSKLNNYKKMLEESLRSNSQLIKDL